MATLLQRFKTWVFESRSFIFSWYTKDRNQIQEPTKSLVELPSSLRKKLVVETNKLPNNPTDTEVIRSSIDETFEQWRSQPKSAENSIVIVASPVMVVSRIVIDIIENWSAEKEVSVRILPWNNRPADANTILEKLQHYVETETTKIDSDLTEVIVIPNLSWCFLRSMDGLDSIDYLQQMLLHDPARFWIIATGQITWDYLNSITDIEADCGRVSPLPKLDRDSLREWLKPVISELNITFANPRLESKILDGDRDAETVYFEDLASISQGISIVALQAFLASVSYEPADEDRKHGILQAESPELPNLPDLESIDRYILYFLLLHQDINMTALAYSIGDRESAIRGRIKFFRREGLIEEKDAILKINPIYYPKLKQELLDNNFVINEFG